MAVVNFCPQRSQTMSAMQSVLQYVLQPHKTEVEGNHFISGIHCSPQTAFTEFKTTKQLYRKTGGIQFYHIVQSFAPQDNLSIAEFHAIGRQLAEKRFPGFEVVVATHTDTNHIHNHFVINSVSHQTGKKLHHNRASLMEHRTVSDELCIQYGLSVLPEKPVPKKSKSMTPKEYQVFSRGESWKMELIRTIENALLYAENKEEYIQLMEREGYSLRWTETRKSVTYTCPNGKKCRDNKLHDDTYLKENLEYLFAFRETHGFTPGTPEPEDMWLTYAEHMNPQSPTLNDKDFERRCVQREKFLELVNEDSYQEYQQDFELSY